MKNRFSAVIVHLSEKAKSSDINMLPKIGTATVKNMPLTVNIPVWTADIAARFKRYAYLKITKMVKIKYAFQDKRANSGN